MKPTPSGWPRISSSLYYQDAAKAIDWLCHAFGFELQLKIEGEGGRIEHSELRYGEGLVMVGEETPGPRRPEATWRQSPRSIQGANTQNMMLYVDDVDAHCARARAAGATIASEPTNTDYGDEYWEDRGYEAVDLEGHHWWFYQRLRDPLK
jgi:uncharacterized glyoxalase superfamily protein PhnB